MCLQDLCRKNQDFSVFMDKYLDIKGIANKSELDFDSAFVQELLKNLNKRKSELVRHDPEQHYSGNKNKVTFNSQVHTNNVASTLSLSKIDESVVQDLKQRVFAKQKALEDTLKDRYDKSPTRDHSKDIKHEDFEKINPKAEIEKQIFEKHQ